MKNALPSRLVNLFHGRGQSCGSGRLILLGYGFDDLLGGGADPAFPPTVTFLGLETLAMSFDRRFVFQHKGES